MIQISEIRNADLKSLAKSIDNGDEKLTNVVLQRLISGVSTLQNNRLDEVNALKGELEFLENQSAPSMAPPGTGKAFGALGLGVLSFFTGKKWVKL